MSRMEEYEAMMADLAQPNPKLDSALDRAYQRKRRNIRRMLLEPAAGLAACFAIFVLLVNFCAPVAYACSKVPVLRELAEAVTFSPSLMDAVENEYVQPMELSQTESGITAEIAYLIVDQKQVNVFYRLKSEQYAQLTADPEIRDIHDARPASCGYSTNGYGMQNGELCCLSIDFMDGNVPDRLKVRLDVYSNAVTQEHMVPENAIADIFEDTPEYSQNYIANFEFLLEFDPKFTAAGKVLPVNQTVLLEGQSVTITNIEIYPTHMRIEIAEDEGNTAWLKHLYFYVETDWGMKFEPVSNGITATGSTDSPSMMSYRADSSYFYEADHLKLVITGAQWLRKDLEKTYVNLVTGETGELPEGASFDSARRTGDGWVVEFRADWEEGEPMHQLFRHLFYDASGKEYEINMWSSTLGDPDENGNTTYFYDSFPLKNYPFNEVWLCPQYSHFWTAEHAVEIMVQ